MVRYGLIGEKLGHSFSADYFNKKFQKEGIDARYDLFPLSTISEFPLLIAKYKDLRGLNVTIPYKQKVIAFLNNLSEDAKDIGAVNVIRIERSGDNINLTGYNSDCVGFKDSLVPILQPYITKALILGTGGASKAVAYVLKKLGINFTFVSRTPKENCLTYDDLNENIIRDNKLIINTTPLGMYPDIEKCPPIPYQYLSSCHLCYDLIYNPSETKFLKLSSQNGAMTKNGMEMLELQAVASWDFWNL